MSDAEQRFTTKFVRGSDAECWPWTGSKNAKGYGRFRQNGRSCQAHRVAYERAVGPIPDGLVLDHLCRNTSCVNPRHLEPVTHHENILRGVAQAARNARKTHCCRGHRLTGANLRLQTGRAGRQRRACVTCQRARQMVRHATSKGRELSLDLAIKVVAQASPELAAAAA